MADAALNWTSEVKGCTSEPYSVIAMFMVTVPLVDELTGGTLGEPVTSAAVTGDSAWLELMGAWATAAETGAVADGVGAFAAPVELLMILIQAQEESAPVGPTQTPLRRELSDSHISGQRCSVGQKDCQDGVCILYSTFSCSSSPLSAVQVV